MFTIYPSNKIYEWSVGYSIRSTNLSLNGRYVNFAMQGVKECPVLQFEKVDNFVSVNIPNILLQHHGSIQVYIYDAEHKGIEYTLNYNIYYRKKPDDYIYTETPVIEFAEISSYIEDTKKYIDKTKEDIASTKDEFIGNVDSIKNDISQLSESIHEILDGNFVRKNPFVFSDIEEKGVSIYFDDDGYLHTTGTANASGKITTDASMYLEKGTYYLITFKKIGIAKPTMYITDATGQNIATFRASDTKISFNVSESGMYGVFLWVNANESFDMVTGYVLSNVEVSEFYKSRYESVLDNSVKELDASFNDVFRMSSNVLEPVSFVKEGVTVEYSDGVFNVTGTHTGFSRIPVGIINPKDSGSHTLGFVDKNENGKPTMYVTDGTEIVGTWREISNTLTVSLEKGTTYALEIYVGNGFVCNYALSLICEFGSSISEFVKYGRLLKKDHDLSNYSFSICGVSIDTYSGWIPEGNASYYYSNNLASVDMTWWKKLINETGINLVMNNSWSGACASTINGLASSGVQRCTNLSKDGKNPDIIIIGMFGANDWAWSPVGEYKFSTKLPSKDVDLTNADNYALYESVIKTYRGAMATIYKRIHEAYPHARVYALDMYNYYRGADLDPAGRGETQNIPLFNKALYDVSEWFGVTVIKGSECGINAINSVDYCVDASTGTALHPNNDGHTLIYKKVLSQLLTDYCM